MLSFFDIFSSVDEVNRRETLAASNSRLGCYGHSLNSINGLLRYEIRFDAANAHATFARSATSAHRTPAAPRSATT
jgi:hypothetical protein